MSPLLAGVARRFGGELSVLAPPYRTLSSLRSLPGVGDLPLGCVVVGRGDAALPVLADLTAAAYRWPWIIPCVALDVEHEPLEPLLMLVTELRDRLAVAKEAVGGRGIELAAVVVAVRKRESPAPRLLAEWIAKRLKRAELGAPLCSQFRQALEGVPASDGCSVSTFSRFFRRYGKYTARDWRALARLCVYAAAGPDCLASASVTLSLRTARSYARQYLALPYQRFAECLGWEWVLEAGLRSGRYL